MHTKPLTSFISFPRRLNAVFICVFYATAFSLPALTLAFGLDRIGPIDPHVVPAYRLA